MVRRAGRARPHVPSPKTGEFGLRPQDLHSVYSLPTSASSAQTIAIVDAYNDPNAEADLKTYSEEFGLPLCTKANGCFDQVSQKSGAPLPFPTTTAELEALWESPTKEVKEEAEEIAGWGTEISLDIETAHATCQSCHILLVEANDPANENLVEAERRAEALGATVISNSWGTSEAFIGPASDQHAPFYDPGIVITASAGDDGFRNWAAPSGRTQHHAVPGFLAARRVGRRHAAHDARPRRHLAGRERLERLRRGRGWLQRRLHRARLAAAGRRLDRGRLREQTRGRRRLG